MAILTPITLWKDFDDTLPLNPKIASQRVCNGMIVREVYFYGRLTEMGRVKIYARWICPQDEERFPAVMLLSEAGFQPDMQLVRRLVNGGFGVLCVDYCGENGNLPCTYYPSDVDYANYVRADRAMTHADNSAKETSWYEWACVARYAVKFLLGQPDVKCVGALGLRTGGEILFKIAPYVPIRCMISVCAAGWLAYQNIDKFTNDNKPIFDEERHRFIAGLDSQTYAPYVNCPVLLIAAANDKKYNYDRVHDTFLQINQKVEKALLFSSHGNGLVGTHSLDNIFLFLDKYCKERSVYIPKPVGFSIQENEAGELTVTVKTDPAGEPVECGYFFTEHITAFKTREWTRVMGNTENLNENSQVDIPLAVYEGSERILVYAFARYSNGFSTTSKIQSFAIDKNYTNRLPKNRVLYDAREDRRNGFTSISGRSVADCFMIGSRADLAIVPGYGGIAGITACGAIVTYRVGEARYEAPPSASFSCDLWAKEDSEVRITFYKDSDEGSGYSTVLKLSGGGKWKNFLIDPDDLKSESGESLASFQGLISVVIRLGTGIVLNNIVWM